ncbi:helix-turn-helix domain-containing protein [Streptomyces sp. NPDC057002]|uniref:helix-turn-helix domain-containing protein n=1 Tax=Streptomyces sp. NPDC057002 TaxID=3345992 RepID=UPI0036332AC6
MYPTSEQEQQMLLHCAHARYVWNLAVEQHAHWRRDKAHHRPDGKRTGAPSFAEQCRLAQEACARGLPRHRRRSCTRVRAGRPAGR